MTIYIDILMEKAILEINLLEQKTASNNKRIEKSIT